MNLLLIRHADAGTQDSTRFPDDTLRPLTVKGRQAQAKMSRRLRRRGFVPDRILSSPWSRAWQTAEIVAEVTRAKHGPEACPALAQEPDLAKLAEATGQLPPQEIVALVGHEPWLGELGSMLLAGDPNTVHIDFPKSGVLSIEISEIASGAGTLKFLWRPRKS
jgi:phosphohistidine phosphatase